MTPSSRKALVVLVAFFLTAAAVSAEPRSGARARSARSAVSNPMESFSGLWSVLTGFWTKNGCQVDPNGRCLPAKNGCSVDPSGICLPTKNGCSADPSGRCLPAATTTLDNGCSADPDGRCAK
jgi:hypothetical protein